MKIPHLIHRFVDHVIRNKYRYTTLALVLWLGKCGVEQLGEWGAAQLECNTIQMPSETLPGIGPLKIALVTDIHNNPQQLNKAVELLREESPDLIILGGDLVTAGERFKRTRWAVNALRSFTEIAPTYAILGNHDYEKQEQVERVLQTAGVTLLRNQSVDWTSPAGQTLRIVGLGDWNEGDDAPHACLKKHGEEPLPVLLLSHDPESRWNLREYDWDLMLSGHNHGGQIGIPFTDTYISLRSSMPAGAYDFENGKRVFVSRGVGSIWNMRFFCAPEINILIIPEKTEKITQP